MLTLNTKVDRTDSIFAELVLPYELRENSRLRAALASGEEVAIFTVRGTVLRNNDLLKGDDGRVVQIVAAQEPTYRVTCGTPDNLLRCAFHLGNRHTQTQVGEGFLRILQDSVLKEMLEGLGATVTAENAQFEPEAGAYSGGGHHHHDGHHHHARGPLAPIPVHQKIHRPSDSKS
ncbi:MULTISPECIES: urease accessory protein UreE [unclassified Nitrosospira]|uniref:urease accessory protein UreE n=1 Tax=unclassified Nitrosospira TaxID=2609267 RepID=UPI000D2FBFAA|nr:MULTISPECIES: urease accessory protein UreE [unclassified Nitrosospira]PTR16535.1 urease accessory protein [Nitrosospira sp. Nsp2]WON73429.1 urease accessory protein UreE [Nitrosospira sp. Is2]